MNFLTNFGVLVLIVLALAKSSFAAIDDDCSADVTLCSTANHEVCSITGVCECAVWYYDKDAAGACVAVIGDKTCAVAGDCGLDHTTCTADQCACDTNYGLSHDNHCVPDCGEPSITGATIETPGNTLFLDSAIVTCIVGYTKVGTGMITCMQTGQWSTHTTCRVTDCGDPIVTGGQFTADAGTQYLDKATITCNLGYDLQGSDKLTCQADADWSTDGSCAKKDCGDPEVAHGTATLVGTTTWFGDTAAVACDADYGISGPDTITCEATGLWSTATTCKIVCDAAPAPTHGTVEATSTFEGATATQSCDDGYQAAGTAEITCEDTGDWTTGITCSLKNCGDPEVAHGTATLVGTTTWFGDTAAVACDADYGLSGPDTITCQATGMWSDTSCKIDCGAAPAPTDGTVSEATSTLAGGTATQTCDEGHDTTGTALITCQESGDWTTGITCAIKDCGDPVVDHGTVTLVGTTTWFGDTATVACDTDYGISGPVTITCTATGQWSTATSCKIDCGAAPTPTHGTLTVAATSTLAGGTATQTCNVGYEASGTPEITCQESGDWTTGITCAIKDCDDPTAPQSSTVTLTIEDLTTFGAKATVSCDKGLECARGRQNCTITCAATGWSSVICNGSGRAAVGWMSALLVVLVSAMLNYMY